MKRNCSAENLREEGWQLQLNGDIENNRYALKKSLEGQAILLVAPFEVLRKMCTCLKNWFCFAEKLLIQTT